MAYYLTYKGNQRQQSEERPYKLVSGNIKSSDMVWYFTYKTIIEGCIAPSHLKYFGLVPHKGI